MLASFRKASQAWYAKLLFIPLIVMFAVWGIGDIMRMRASNQPAITVGDIKISPQQVAEDFRRDAEQLQRMSGGKITLEQARQMGFMNQTIQRLVSESLLDQAGERLGLAVDDNTLRKAIAAIPAFHDQNDKFDPKLFHAALSANGFTEARFLDVERKEIQRYEVSDIVALGTAVPDALLDPIFRYRNEKRIAELIPFAASAMPAPATPDDAVLQSYFKDHAAQFTAPEMRTVSAIILRGADLAADYKPTDAQIAKAYQDRQSEFATDETRHLRQVFFSDQESAQKLVDAIKSGASFADAAKAAGKSVDDLGQVQRKGLPIDAVAEATFSASVPGIAGPVQTPLGWNVFEVTDMKPAGAKPLAEVRDQIAADLVKEEASNRLNALSTKVEDAIGGGASLDEVATTANAKVFKVADMDQAGNGPDGKPVPGLPAGAAFRDAAFKTAKGSMSELTALDGKDDGYFVLRVDDVAPPALKPFENVRDAVIAAVALEGRLDEAKKVADSAVARLNAGESAQTVAGAIKVTVTPPFTRAGGDAAPAPIAAAAFNLAAGKAVAVPVGDTVYAVRLASVMAADPKADQADLDALREQLRQSVQNDLSQQYLMALQHEIGVKIQPALIDQQFTQAQ